MALEATSTPTTSYAVEINPPRFLTNILTVFRRELGEAVTSRWFLLYTLAFAVLGLAVSYISAAGAGGAGLSGYGRTSAGLVNLVLLVAPLMSLTAGAGLIAPDRERGMLAYVLAQPVLRSEVLIGKYAGAAAALASCLCLGLGACAAILSWKGGATRPGALLELAGLSFLLSLAGLSLGTLISVLSRRVAMAMGASVFLWLVLVFVSDLGLMAGTVAFRISIQKLFFVSLLNPMQIFKMWSLYGIEASLDVLGPAGLYATEEYGRQLHWIFAGCMTAWIVFPLLIAATLFSRRASA